MLSFLFETNAQRKEHLSNFMVGSGVALWICGLIAAVYCVAKGKHLGFIEDEA